MMLDIDGALVIHEGPRRLRWKHEPGSTVVTGAGQQAPQLRRIVDRVWPDCATQRQIRRQIEHGKKVVVVFDDSDPVVMISPECLPTVPAGSVVRENPDCGSVALSIPLFTWLSPADRSRGEAFSAYARSISRRIPGSAQPPVLVEGALVGTGEPLRFVFQTRSMTIDVVRQVIHHLYAVRNPTTMPVPTARQTSALLTSQLRSKAA